MKSKIALAVILASVLLAGCTVVPTKNTNVPTGNVNGQTTSFTAQIVQLLNNGASIQEIGNPNLTLPSDINSNQIEKYFRLDAIMFALVMRNSMNVVLSLPAGFTPTYSGVLVAPQGSAHWTKLLEIKDAVATDKNNPYYLAVDNKKLLLTVVDQNGSGSGEGIEKVFTLSAANNWTLDSCYYFGGSYSDPSTDGDYYAFSAKFASQTPKPIASCSDVQLVSLE